MITKLKATISLLPWTSPGKWRPALFLALAFVGWPGWARPVVAEEICAVRIDEHLLERPFGAAGIDALSRRYAFAKADEVPVYENPTDEGDGVPPVRFLPDGYIGLSLSNPQPLLVNGREWYQVNPKEYVRGDLLELVQSSTYQGVLVPHFLDKPFAWVLFNTKVSRAPGMEPEKDALFLPERSLVFIYEMREVDGEKWCNVGCGWWAPYRRLGLVVRESRPEGVKESERWLDVSLNEQTLSAYQGDRMVFSTLISTGNSQFPTVRGLYRIRLKIVSKKMSGGEETGDYYFLEDVPWQMFFYQGFGFHASYWHDLFGLPTSHGCVNLSPMDAKWLFDWTGPRLNPRQGWAESSRHNLGTWVFVHD